jgi:hypothetical protein
MSSNPNAPLTVLVIAPGIAPTLSVVDDPTLDFWQGIVDGYIEPISPADSDSGAWGAFCDEEGKIKGKPLNIAATAFADVIGWMGLAWGDALVGTVVFCGAADHDGHTLGLPDLTIEHAQAFFGDALIDARGVTA